MPWVDNDIVVVISQYLQVRAQILPFTGEFSSGQKAEDVMIAGEE